MKQGIFEVFGTGQLGLKADDLNQHAEILTSIGLTIPEGIVLATDVFDQLTKEVNFETFSTETEKLTCPAFLLSLNEEILDRLTVSKPYAVRSSALSERGGTGIYRSTFFYPTGNKTEDLQNLWRSEVAVYASEFSHDANLWREKTHSPMGMAILIQPVVGFHFKDNFLPALSGVAYTSYNGLPTIRVVVGLGTQAVNGEGIIYNLPQNEFFYFQRELWDQEEADAISPTGEIGRVHTHYEEIHREIGRGFQAFNDLFDKLTQLKKHGNFYLEWVILGNQVYVVQIATHEDRLAGDISFSSDNHFLLLKGRDVFNSGQATCQSIVLIHEWSRLTSETLEHLNDTKKDYLLIIPQEALSEIEDITGDGRISFRHFSNALAVVEMQRIYTMKQFKMLAMIGKYPADHSSGTGATHFSQLCKRTNILFIGGEFDLSPLLILPEDKVDTKNPTAVTIFNVTAEVVVNSSKKEGFVYIQKPAQE